MGPVLIDIPMDVQQIEVPKNKLKKLFQQNLPYQKLKKSKKLKISLMTQKDHSFFMAQESVFRVCKMR